MAALTNILNAERDLNSDHASALQSLLSDVSLEVTPRDRRSLEAAAQVLPPGTEVFIAALPNDTVDNVVAAAAQLRRAGLTPVPHVVARNIENPAALDRLLGRLVDEAQLDRALVLGGDRDKPAGEFTSSLQLLQTGLIQKHGVRKIRIGCYPEGHPKISDAVLDEARDAKLALAEQQGLDVTLISQFCFDPAPIISFAKRIRAQGVKAPFRVGVAGPADRGLLIKYALICGVGNSIRVLKGRADLAMNTLSGETPEALLTAVAQAQQSEPALGIAGAHFFTFGSLQKSAHWIADHR